MAEAQAPELQALIEQVSQTGTIVASAGLMLTSALLNCPMTEGAEGYAALNDHTRVLTHGAGEDNLNAVAAIAYVARAIGGHDVLETHPEVPQLLGVIEEWQRGGRSYRDLRYVYARAVEYVSADVKQLTEILKALRELWESKDE